VLLAYTGYQLEDGFSSEVGRRGVCCAALVNGYAGGEDMVLRKVKLE
jgi:hypothetical protein